MLVSLNLESVWYWRAESLQLLAYLAQDVQFPIHLVSEFAKTHDARQMRSVAQKMLDIASQLQTSPSPGMSKDDLRKLRIAVENSSRTIIRRQQNLCWMLIRYCSDGLIQISIDWTCFATLEKTQKAKGQKAETKRIRSTSNADAHKMPLRSEWIC